MLEVSLWVRERKQRKGRKRDGDGFLRSGWQKPASASGNKKPIQPQHAAIVGSSGVCSSGVQESDVGVKMGWIGVGCRDSFTSILHQASNIQDSTTREGTKRRRL